MLAIRRAIRRHNRNRWLIISFGLLVSIVLLMKSYGIDSLMAIIAWFGISLFILLAFVQLFNNKSAPKRLYDILCNSPDDLVWIYKTDIIRLPFGIELFSSSYLHFKGRNKEEFVINTDSSEAKIIYRKLKQWLPKASFGYSTEKQQAYQDNPLRLLKR